MRLHNDTWLHIAKSIAIGSQKRVRHGSERTEAMTVGNREDRWWAYCQRCKAGAVEMKSHVFANSTAPAESTALTHPLDGVPIAQLQPYEQQMIASFLASKNMDLSYLHPTNVTWSRTRQRLLLDTPYGLMGRDTTGRSEQKWLTYDRQHWINDPRLYVCPDVILVEDCFSWAKVGYALGDIREVAVYCTLGTAIHDSLFLHLMKTARRVVSFYDGDHAGYEGCLRNRTRLGAVSLNVSAGTTEQCAPPGLDPKDMKAGQIVQHVHSLFTN